MTRLVSQQFPIALDRYLAAVPAMSLNPFAPFAEATAWREDEGGNQRSEDRGRMSEVSDLIRIFQNS